MMCEQLGCAPSELHDKHPNLTERDKWFLIDYGFEKQKRELEGIANLLKTAFGAK